MPQPIHSHRFKWESCNTYSRTCLSQFYWATQDRVCNKRNASFRSIFTFPSKHEKCKLGSLQSRHHALTLTQPDPLYDLIIDEQLSKNEYPKTKLERARSATHTSLMAKVLTKEIWDKYKHAYSSGPAKWTIARAINTGVMHPKSFVGCHAGDAESYDDFRDFFYPIIEAYHVGFKVADGEEILKNMGSPSDRLNPDKISAQFSASAKQKIVSTRIRLARNFADFPLNPGGSVETRKQVLELLRKVYRVFDQDAELKGSLFEHADMSHRQKQQLIDDRLLFRGADGMQAASGYHVGWPHGRGIFHNKAKTFVNWINEGDHIRIISMDSGSDIKAVFALLSKGAQSIEETAKKFMGTEKVFIMHPKLGAVTCCPTNLGTGLRGSVHIKVPKLIKAWGFERIDEFCRKRHCQARGSSGEHSEVVDRIGVSNWRRIGFPEYTLIGDMIECVNEIVSLEDSIAD